MAKRIVLFGLAMLVLAGAANVATASLWNSSLAMNQITTFEDQNRESIVDINLDGFISGRSAGADGTWGTDDDVEGDAFFGYLRFDDRTIPSAIALPPDIYAVFSFELVSITSPVLGGTAHIHNAVFAPQATPIGLALGLDLNALTGGDVALAGLPIGAAGVSTVSVYEDLGANLLDQIVPDSPGVGFGFHDITDYAAAISGAGTLDLIAGVVAPVDFMFGSFTFQDPGGVFLVDPIDGPAGIAALNTATLAGGTIGFSNSFNLALTIQASSPPGIYLPLVPIANPIVGGITSHDLTVTNGQVSGASDVLLPGVPPLPSGNGVTASPYFGSYTDPATGAVYPFFGVTTNADSSVWAIPEPSSLAIWGLLGLGLLGLARRRKK